MLSTPAPYPHPGAAAFVRGTGEPCRIIQRNADDTCLVSLTDRRYPREAASGNRTVPLADLAATQEEASAPQPSRRRKAA